MASFLTDWLRGKVGSGFFSWTDSDVKALLVAGGLDYDPLPTPTTIDGLAGFELAAVGYTRQDVTTRAIDAPAGTDSGVAGWTCDEIVWTGIEATTVAGAWVIDYHDADDTASFFVAWLDLRDEDGNDLAVDGELRITFPDSVFANVSPGG